MSEDASKLVRDTWNKRVDNTIEEKYIKTMKQTAEILKEHFNYIAVLCKALKLDFDYVNQLRKGYDEGDKELLKSINFDEMIDVYEELRLVHYNLWNSSYKSYGFENLDIRYGGKIARFKTAKMRVNDFIEGRIDDIPELKDEKLKFTAERIQYNRYKMIATPYVV